MNRQGVRYSASAVLVSTMLLLGIAAPASAGTSTMYRSSGYQATTWWTQIDGTPRGSRFGNVHIGELYAYEVQRGKGDVFGWIEDFDCRRGAEPWGRGCRWIGSRFLEGYGLDFTVSRKLTTARLTGQLVAYGGGHGSEGEVGRPTADVTWTGVGDSSRTRYSYRWSSDGWNSSGSYMATGRAATVDGILGPMGFHPDRSGGSLTHWRDNERTRSG